MGQFKGVTVTIIGVVLIIVGFWLKDIRTSIFLHLRFGIDLNPNYGWILIAIGAAITILGIWMWTSSLQISPHDD